MTQDHLEWAKMADLQDAPGSPGIAPRWTSSDKSGVGTALSALSRVWFTISHGILNEVYYPRVDQACTRDLGFLVTDGVPGGFFSEEKRDTDSTIESVDDGIPAYRLTNRCRDGRYVIEKLVVADPRHDVVLQQVTLRQLGEGPKLRLFALLAPHLVNGGANNNALLGDYKGLPMLFAEGDGTSIAMACSHPWLARSVGYVGASDGWQLLQRHGSLAEQFDRALGGNVALAAELPVDAGTVTVALAFGRGTGEAGFRARASLQRPFEAILDEYCTAWGRWQAGLRPLEGASTRHNTYRISTAVLRAHDSPSFPGGLIASLSIPWGATKGDDDLGGYHLIWPRDLVETAGGLIACGAREDTRRVLEYLRAVQEQDGHWPQNCWLDGQPYWRGVQMDECAFPILLVDMALRHGVIAPEEADAYWPMVRDAAGYVVRNGPLTGQDRWEEDEGYSPFTLAVEISSLLAGAELAERAGEPDTARFLRDTADAWNAAVESWCYAPSGALAARHGVDGYYVRIAPPKGGTADSDPRGRVTVRNRLAGEGDVAADTMVSPDALALVRFGLRRADDPRIRDTVTVVDAVLRRDLPGGPCWYRYNGDGYGEHEDGSPFDGVGVGRLWPLLTGERAHYAIAAGRMGEARDLLRAMESFTSSGGLLPEQVWDSPDLPDRELFRGRPSGSAMPLVWAHAEHIKLCRSLADGAVFDMPPQAFARYCAGTAARPRVQPWRLDWRARTVAAGQVLRLDLPRPTQVRWSDDGGASFRTLASVPTNLGVHVAEIPAGTYAPGKTLVLDLGNERYTVEVIPSAQT